MILIKHNKIYQMNGRKLIKKPVKEELKYIQNWKIVFIKQEKM